MREKDEVCDMNEVDLLKKDLERSKYTVALCCSGLLEESGRASMRKQSRAYEIEEKYGYSPEEIFSAAFLSTRPEKFFQYYKAEVLPGDLKPGASYYYLKEMEDAGMIQLIITNNACNFHTKVGSKNVMAIHGDVENNICTGCGKRFDAAYIANSRGIPSCDVCGKLIRPQVAMFGEMLDNHLMTKAINEIKKADTLLVIGSGLNGPFAERYVKHFNGRKLIVINPEMSYRDRVANLVINRPISEVLHELLHGEEIPEKEEN
jgi:NAD-dependent deacetylase